MSGASEPTFLDGLALALAKFWPGIAGALIALRWQPAEASRLDRAVSAIGGFVSAIYVAPMIVGIANVSSHRIEAGIVFLCGLFSMVVVGELMLAVRSIQLAEIARDMLRTILRLPRKGE